MPEEEVVGKQDGTLRLGCRRWPQDGEQCGLVEQNGGNTPIS